MSTHAQPLSVTEQNKHLVHRWFEEVWNQSRREVIAEILAPDCVLHDGAVQIHGPKEFEQFHDGLREQFSDIRITPSISICEGDLASLRWTVNCRDKSSDKNVAATGISIVRIKDGRFVEAWQNWDQAGVAAQISA
ncbi:MAG TPA: nuclear transport factor 2 family protein [Candidatus Acidoferrum sp.]|nr:nuclear transport factor 2 family protein [Candidatus Acidoferrum sp.]